MELTRDAVEFRNREGPWPQRRLRRWARTARRDRDEHHLARIAPESLRPQAGGAGRADQDRHRCGPRSGRCSPPSSARLPSPSWPRAASPITTPPWYQGFDPTNQAMTGLALATLAIGVLGVLAVTGEYGTGTIRSSLAAAPRRPLLLWRARCSSWGAYRPGRGRGAHLRLLRDRPSRPLGRRGADRHPRPAGRAPRRGALRRVPGPARPPRARPGRDHPAHGGGHWPPIVGVTFLLPLLLQRIPGDPSRFTPVPILANSVSAVVPQSHQVSAPVGFLLMVLYCDRARHRGCADRPA